RDAGVDARTGGDRIAFGRFGWQPRCRSVVGGSRSEDVGVNSVESIESQDYGEHLLVRAFTDARENSDNILIIGHTDTVHPRGSFKERPWREEDGRIYGPGIFDMKANCALALEVIRACAALDLTPRR